MPAVGITGAQFVVKVGATTYSDQVTTGTITITPTITRTKTLSGVNYDQTDLMTAVSIEFLYDDNAGMYNSLENSIVAGTSIALEITGATGKWTGSAMAIDGLETKFDAAGVAMATLSCQGSMTFA